MGFPKGGWCGVKLERGEGLRWNLAEMEWRKAGWAD